MIIRRLPLDLRAKEGRKEKALRLIFLFPVVPGASSPVTRVSLAFRARLCVKNEVPEVACVASVSNRVIARKLERKQKTKKKFFFALVPAF